MPGIQRLLFFPACLACGLLALAFWRWQAMPVALADVPGGRLQCLSYTAFEPGEIGETAPGWVSPARITDDLKRLSAFTSCLRLYTPLGNTPRVVQAASEQGFTVLLGAWIGSNLEQNDKEIRGALDLARRYPGTVRLIVVGNEVLLRRELPARKLAALINEVRAESPVPVAYADVAHFIAGNPEVAAAADELLIHLLPYWDDPAPPSAEIAATQVLQGYEEFRAKFPGKRIMIGETGWPSAGRQRGPGRPGVVEQAGFVREFAALAAQRSIAYNLIEAIDQPWKRPSEGTVGAYWGILDQDRVAKFSLTGPVSEWRHWRPWWLATTALAMLMLALALPSGLTPARWLAWSAIALATGLALVFQWRFTMLASASPAGRLLGASGALLTLIAALWLLARLRHGALSPPAPLAELGRSLHRPMMLARSIALRHAAFVGLVMIPMAWFSMTLAFAPRHRDIPVAFFLLPAVALAACLHRSDGARGDRREEATLALVIAACALAQVEGGNPQALAWLALAAMVSVPWLGALRGEFTRIGTLLADTRQAQHRNQRS